VLAWLSAHGVEAKNIKSYGDALDVKCTAAQAEKLFGTELFTFTHAETSASVVRQWGEYSLPSSVKSQIELVTGLSTFPIPHLRLTPNAVNMPNTGTYGVVPATLDALYEISASHRAMYEASEGFVVSSLGVIEFQGQNFAQSDIAAEDAGVGLPTVTIPSAQIVGPNDQTSPQTESSLDIEMTTNIVPTAQNWFWLEAGNGWLYQFGVHFFGTKSVPLVASISYGWFEGDQCTVDPTGQ
jgi:hypothetical protein